jgi:hypothetical protein
MYLLSDFHSSVFDSRFFLAISLISWFDIFLFHLSLLCWQIGYPVHRDIMGLYRNLVFNGHYNDNYDQLSDDKLRVEKLTSLI